ncbi:hypothetical protein FQA39_LY05567 [Lamprigera yunnana]|nr:hypothetical protein FQA39_LY05567 [Lamprigera yunnana]
MKCVRNGAVSASVFSNGPDLIQEYTKLKEYKKQNHSLIYVGKTMQEEMRRQYQGTKIWLSENIYKKGTFKEFTTCKDNVHLTCVFE